MRFKIRNLIPSAGTGETFGKVIIDYLSNFQTSLDSYFWSVAFTFHLYFDLGLNHSCGDQSNKTNGTLERDIVPKGLNTRELVHGSINLT
jgi:hypothetical protein